MKRNLLLMVTLFLACTLSMAQSRELKVLSFNLRWGEIASLQKIGEYVKSLNPDIVLLQEVDINTKRPKAPAQNGRNFISELGYYTQMFSTFGRSIDYSGGYYGLGILSKYPFASTERILLPMGGTSNEQRTMLLGVIELGKGEEIIVASTHLDLTADLRLLQMKEITTVVRKKKLPMLLAGDFNAEPTSPEIEEGMALWKRLCCDAFTFSATKPKTKIDFIFGYPAKEWEVVSSEVPQAILSDHLPLFSVIKLTK